MQQRGLFNTNKDIQFKIKIKELAFISWINNVEYNEQKSQE